MQKWLPLALISFILFSSNLNAANSQPPSGDISLANNSNKTVTASISDFGSFKLDKKESIQVPYFFLFQACSDKPTHCKANFYVDEKPAGYAIFNAALGKVVSLKVHSINVKTHIQEKVLRGITLE